jgi:hypothetical protein
VALVDLLLHPPCLLIHVLPLDHCYRFAVPVPHLE